MKKQKKVLFSKERIKKNWKKIIVSLVAIGIISLLITLPLVLQKNSDEKKFNILRAKIEKYDFSKMIVLKDENDVDIPKNKNKIKNIIIEKIEKENNKLSQEEKDSISLINVNSWDKITHEATIISVQIKFGTKAKTYDFYFIREAINNKELIEQKLSKTVIDEKVIILPDTNNLDLQNSDDKEKVKQGIIGAINAKNPNNKLTKEEENSIAINNLDGIVKHDKILLIQISSSILIDSDKVLSLYNFNILRSPLNVSEKYDVLKAKLNNVDKTQLIIVPKSSYKFKTNDASSLNYVKSLIFDHINKYNLSNKLNDEEKNAFIYGPFPSSEIVFISNGYVDIKFSFVIDKVYDLDLNFSFGFILQRD